MMAQYRGGGSVAGMLQQAVSTSESYKTGYQHEDRHKELATQSPTLSPDIAIMHVEKQEEYA